LPGMASFLYPLEAPGFPGREEPESFLIFSFFSTNRRQRYNLYFQPLRQLISGIFIATDPEMTGRCIILLFIVLAFIGELARAQKKTTIPSKTNASLNTPPRNDSITVPLSQRSLFIPPKKNLFTTHVDMELGAARVERGDKTGLGFSASVKGLYQSAGAMYKSLGLGVTMMNSMSRDSSGGSHQAGIIHFPIGIGFAMGDDRAMIINGIDILPAYYFNTSGAVRERAFCVGAGVDLGYDIRVGPRLHLGMMGKLQFFQPFDKDEHTDWPRFGFVGVGVIMRYD
jgi:hypothetical protein